MIPMPNILILSSVGLVIAVIISKRSQANSVTFCVVFGLENRLYCKNKALLMGKCLIKINDGNLTIMWYGCDKYHSFHTLSII